MDSNITNDGNIAVDVAILGGGPAGAAAAISLKQLDAGLRVAIVESSKYDAWRAGETLSPGCQEIMHGLGCWQAFLDAGFRKSPGTRAVWGDADVYDNDFVFSMRGSGWHVDRARFDALLVQCAREAGAELIDGRFIEADRDGSSFRIVLRGAATIRARFVIDCTGRAACFATQFGASPIADDRLIGVCGLLESSDRDATTLVEAEADGWWYSAPISDSDTAVASCTVVAWMSDSDLVRDSRMSDPARWLEHLQHTTWTRARVSGGLLQPLRVWAAHSQRLSRLRGEGWVAAGDAATAYDPLSSLGILKAMRSGRVAAYVAFDALNGRDSGARYEQLVAGEYTNYCETKRWYYSQERRWPNQPFWQRRGRLVSVAA